ncbi:MAG: DUF2934 domain-containing protein [Cyanobacteria bacterium]|nr:DUF2934 domain-containing protein [Cyanobacteriota bacterium]
MSADEPAPLSNPDEPAVVGPGAGREIDCAQIAAYAYERYLARGQADGHDLDDWLEAERQVRGGRPGILRLPRAGEVRGTLGDRARRGENHGADDAKNN